MKQDDNAGTHKKPYGKPRLRTIDLAAEEVLAVGCKIQNVRGFANPAPHCRVPRRCFAHGS